MIQYDRYGVSVRGYDVLCNLVTVAEEVKAKFNVDRATFVCGDALDADLSNAGVVWIDNQSWDEGLVNQMFSHMALTLPPNAVVIDYAVADYHSTMNINLKGMFDVVGCANLPVSWDNAFGTVVSVRLSGDLGTGAQSYVHSLIWAIWRCHAIGAMPLVPCH